VEEAVDDAKLTGEETWLERIHRYLVQPSGSNEQQIHGLDAVDGNFGVKLQDLCNAESGVDTFAELSSKSTLVNKPVESAQDELLADFESFITAQDTLPATDFDSFSKLEVPQYGSVGGQRQGYQNEQMEEPRCGQQHDSGPESAEGMESDTCRKEPAETAPCRTYITTANERHNIVANTEYCLRGEPMRDYPLECEENSSTHDSSSTPGRVMSTKVQQRMAPPTQFSEGKVMTGLSSLLSQEEIIASHTTDSNEDKKSSSSESELSSELEDPSVTGKMAAYCGSSIQSRRPPMQRGWAFSFFSPVTGPSEETDADSSEADSSSEIEQNLKASVLGITHPLTRQTSLKRTRTEDEPDFEPRVTHLIHGLPRKDSVPEAPAESVPPVARMAHTMT
jgi:hypothetical protein